MTSLEAKRFLLRGLAKAYVNTPRPLRAVALQKAFAMHPPHLQQMIDKPAQPGPLSMRPFYRAQREARSEFDTGGTSGFNSTGYKKPN